MSKFAKLFDDVKGYNQIVILLHEQEENLHPRISIFWQPDNGGVCSLDLNFDGTSAAWQVAEKAFNELTLERAISAISKVHSFMYE